MKILKKKKKFFFFFFFEIGIFFSNWEKSHLNPIGKGAEFRPLRTPKKIPALANDLSQFERRFLDYEFLGLSWLSLSPDEIDSAV